MSKYYDSDYARNRKKDSIVYKLADGSLVEITKEEYLAESPDLTEADYLELKELSDSIFKEEMDMERKQERAKEKNTIATKGTGAFRSHDEELIDQEEKAKIRAVTNDLLNSGVLTKVQERRFKAHYLDGKSTRQIATEEGRTQRAIWDSLMWARKKLKKYFSK